MKRVCQLGLGSLAVSMLVLVAPGHGADAGSFNPHFEASLADSAPSANSHIVLDFSMFAPDPNFEIVLVFLPEEFGMATDAEVPNGTPVGRLAGNTTLGLLNGPCNTYIGVDFNLMDASTDIERPFPLYAGYNDHDGNGLPENVDYYPSFLNIVAPDVQPRQRLYGQALVSGVQTFINFLVFEPGARIPRLPELDPALGYPTAIFLNDPHDTPSPIPINDFCTPFGTETIVYGETQAGAELRRNPNAPGEYNITAFVRSRWDADNDGIENQLDPCAMTADFAWDARSSSGQGDSDKDGLPASCDPNDNVSNHDQDGDFYQNRQDLCPLLFPSSYPPDPDFDGIGSECDSHDDDGSNGGAANRSDACVTAVVVIGQGGPPAPRVGCPDGPDVPMPLKFEVYPGNTVQRAGTRLLMDAFIYDPLIFRPIAGVQVEFSVTGANNVTGSCVTSNQGSCEFEYLGESLGADTVLATVTTHNQTLTSTTSVSWVDPPPNDDFSGATPIAALPFSGVGHIAAADKEAAESNRCNPRDRTIWYTYTPPEDMFVRFEADRDDVPADVALFRGTSLATIDLVACGTRYLHTGVFEDSIDPRSKESFVDGHLDAGQTYYVRVSGDRSNAAPGNEVAVSMHAVAEADSDCNGEANIRDVIRLLQMAVYDSYARCYGLADADCDRWPGAPDVAWSLRLVAGLQAGPLPDCES